MTDYQFETINIHGKEYVPVHERIKFFRKEYPTMGIIRTQIIHCDNESCLMRAEVIIEGDGVVATGHAREVCGGSNINKTSYVENCETSAIGRALAVLGIGIDSSIASANEVVGAVSQEEQTWNGLEESKAKLEAAAGLGTDALRDWWENHTGHDIRSVIMDTERDWWDSTKAEAERQDADKVKA